MVDEAVNVDLSQAIAAVDQLVARLSEAAAQVGAALSEALSTAISSVDAQVDVGLADASAVTDEINTAVSSADAEVDAGLADPGSITDEIDAAISSADTQVEVDIDPSAIMDGIEAAVAAADPPPVEVGLEVDDSGLSDLSDAADSVGDSTSGAASGMGKLGAANAAMGATAAAASGELGGVAAASSGLLGPVGAAVGGVTALAGVVGKMVGEASEAQTANLLMTRTFGGFADQIRQIDLGGFNGSLDDLAKTVGSDNDQLEIVIARMGSLAQQTGASNDQVKSFTDGISLLSARAVVLNPNLGSAADTAEGLTRAILRGGAALQRYSISLSDEGIAAELAREGIQGQIQDLPRVEQEMIKVNAAVHELGSSLGSDITTGASTARIQFRVFRESIREDMEQAGTALLPLVLALGTELQPVIGGLVKLIGDVANVILSVLGPVLKAIGPNLVTTFKEAGEFIQALSPLLKLVGDLLGALLPPILKVGQELFKWATPLGLALQVMQQVQEHAQGLKEAFGLAGESLDDVGAKLGIDQFEKQRLSLKDYVTTVKTASAAADAAGVTYQTWGAEADRLGVSLTDATAITQGLSAQASAQADVVGTTSAAWATYTAATVVGAQTTLSLGVAIGTATDATNEAAGHLLDLRGNADQAFFTLLKLGNQAPPLMDLLTQSFQHGGLSAAEFTNVAKSFGISLDDLATVEAKAKSGFDDFTAGIKQRGDEVSKALGDVTDATKNLDDKGKANIADFVAEVTKQLTAQAAFSANIATLYESNANRTADAFLKAGPEAAGALQQLIDQGGTAITDTETKFRGLADTAETEGARAAKAAEDNAARGAAAYVKLAPDPAQLAGGIDTAMLAAANELDAKQSGVVASATAIGSAIATGMASGLTAGQAVVNAAASDTIDGALLSAQSAAEIRSPSRLFSRDVGFPLTEGLAEGIRAGYFKVDDAVGDVIAGAQKAAQAQLDNVFSALTAGRGQASAQQHLSDLQSQQNDLLATQAHLPQDMASAQRELNDALAESANITAREQQSINQAQDSVDRIKAQLADQAAGPANLDEAQRQLALNQADADRLGALASTAANNATLGTGTQADASAAQQAFQAQQRAVQQSQQAVDQLTQKLQQNQVTQVDLQVAMEDLADAQTNAVGPTQRLQDAQQALKDLEDKATQTKKDLLAVTQQLPDAQIALLQATERAALAGDAFNQQGLRGIDVLGSLGAAAGLTETQIASLAKAWGGLSSTIATNLGGGQFGAPAGQVDIGTILGQGQRFTDPTEALNELNFVRGLNGAQSSLTMAQAPWNINIYQATDPKAVAYSVASQLGLAAVR